MLMYALIGLSFVLVGIVGLQFSYLFYVDRIYRERKKYMRSLERKCSQLNDRLEAAERRVAEQSDLLEAMYPELGKEDEAWADVIEDR
ncbi:MAG: hypothetical protein ABJB40_01855 [Acidobacteriota bacterium]